jgi:hypothetical protein
LFSTKTGWAGVALSPDGTPSIAGGKWQVSNGGGQTPTWRGDGKELFFTSGSYRIHVASPALLALSLQRHGWARLLLESISLDTVANGALTGSLLE